MDLKSKKKSQPIGIFDSGVGGLSILKELKKTLPNENFVFLADQLYLPYGEKSKEELVQRGLKISDYLIKHHNIKMLVIACNTSTCYSIHTLREKYSFPIVGTVPAIKPAASKTKNKAVAIISTPATSQSKALQDLIENYCQNISMLNISAKGLADLVDKGDTKSADVNNLLSKYLKPLEKNNADYLVLGSTHYSFLRKEIKKILGPDIELIDGAKAIAIQAKSLLSTYNMKNPQQKQGKTLYFTTLDPLKFSKVATFLLKTKIKSKKAAI